MKEQKTMNDVPVKKIFATLVGVFIAFIVLGSIFGSFYRVGERERAVLLTFGKFTATSGPGLNFKLPFVQSIVSFDVATKTLSNVHEKDGLNTYTVDNQEIEGRISFLYQLDPNHLEYVYRNIAATQPELEAKIWVAAVGEFKNAMGEINAIDIPRKRNELTRNFESKLNAFTNNQFKVTISNFQMPNYDTTKKFRDGVEAATLAKIAIEKAEQEKQQALVEAEKAKIVAEGLAQAARQKADGEAYANLTIAKAEAESVEIKGLAQARALEAQTKALGSNPNLVELKKAEKWSGDLPTWVGAGPTPFMSVAPLTK